MRLLVAIGLLGLAIAGCVTPSIPIPPPDPSKMSFALEGAGTPDSRAIFNYEADNNLVDAIVFVYNRDRGVGIIVDANADGSVGPTPAVAAELGNEIVITFQREDQTASKCIKLREGQQSATDFCGP